MSRAWSAASGSPTWLPENRKNKNKNKIPPWEWCRKKKRCCRKEKKRNQSTIRGESEGASRGAARVGAAVWWQSEGRTECEVGACLKLLFYFGT